MKRFLLISFIVSIICAVSVNAQRFSYKRTYLSSGHTLASNHSGTNVAPNMDSVSTLVGGATVVDSFKIPNNTFALNIGFEYTPDSGVDTVLTAKVLDISDSTSVSPTSYVTSDSLYMSTQITTASHHSVSLGVWRFSVGDWISISITNPNAAADSATSLRVYVDTWRY